MSQRKRADDEPGPTSWASNPGVRRSMLSNKRRDTKPELAVRSALHRAGLRYRVDHPPVPGLRRRADIAFTKRRIAVFIDGCFWHGCPQHRTWPRRNADYWGPKIERNRERDLDTNHRLETAGWIALRFWEHEPVDLIVSVIGKAVRRR